MLKEINDSGNDQRNGNRIFQQLKCGFIYALFAKGAKNTVKTEQVTGEYNPERDM